MKSFRTIWCKTKSRVWLQKKSIMILLTIFLIILIMSLMGTMSIAHAQRVVTPPPDPPTLKENRLLEFYIKAGAVWSDEFRRELIGYVWDGCEKSIQGEWRFQKERDIIGISYDEQNKSFLGRVTHPVSEAMRKKQVKPGYLLFWVYFPNVKEVLANLEMSPRMDSPVWVQNLRKLRQCGNMNFEGEEFAFSRGKDAERKRVVQSGLWLTLSGDYIIYQAENYSAMLDRVR